MFWQSAQALGSHVGQQLSSYTGAQSASAMQAASKRPEQVLAPPAAVDAPPTAVDTPAPLPPVDAVAPAFPAPPLPLAPAPLAPVLLAPVPLLVSSPGASTSPSQAAASRTRNTAADLCMTTSRCRRPRQAGKE